MKVHNILMPTDFSACAQAALSHALFLARVFDAELHLLHVLVLYEHHPESVANAFPDDDELYHRLTAIARRAMAESVKAPAARSLRIREEQRHGVAAAPSIVEYADENSIDLIVMGSHGRRGLRRFLLGSVAEETLRSAPCPVWTIHPDQSEEQAGRIRRIVVPDDFSDDALRALRTAQDLARRFDARLDVVHVIPPPVVVGPGVPMVAPPHCVDVTDSVTASLTQRVAAIADTTAAIEPVVLHGAAAIEIVDHAKITGADLIVIGSHGLSGAKRFLMGSVSERVTRAAECPVLVLRHGEPHDGEGPGASRQS